MSTIRYKRTKNEREDEQTLAMHEELAEEAEVEMKEMGTVESGPSTDIPTSFPSGPEIIYKSDRKSNCYLGWAVLTTVLFLSMIVIAILAHQGPRSIVWCCIGDEEVQKCRNMSNHFLYWDFEPKVDCKFSASAEECVKMIDTDAADVFTIDNELLFANRDKLKPLMAEATLEYGLGEYLIAIADNKDNTSILSKASFKNKKACVGNWNLFKGLLGNFTDRVYTAKTCDATQKIANMFQNACVPDSQTYILCGGCKGSTCAKECTTDNFCGYMGALRCLVESGDEAIAFTSHGSLKEIKDNPPSWDNVFNQSDYVLLCPDGSRAGLDEYKTCNLGWMPTRSLVVSKKIRSGNDVDIPTDVIELLYVTQLYFGSHSKTTKDSFNMFESLKKPNQLFQDSTSQLIPLWGNCSAEAYLGDSYTNILHSVNCTKVYHIPGTCHLPQFASTVP